MELLLLAWACSNSERAAAAAVSQAWPSAHFMRLAPVLHRHLLVYPRPPERMLGANGQQADHLVRYSVCACACMLPAIPVKRVL